MSEKPKKTLSPEQLEKMRVGRQKAYAKRKAEREAAKIVSKEKNTATKNNDKEKLLQLELEAMAQQQSRIDNLKIQVERKKEVKAKLKSIKEEEHIEEEHIEEHIEHIEEHIEEVQSEVKEDIEEVKEKVEVKMEKKVRWTDEEYSDVFEKEAKKMRAKIPKQVQHYYDDAVSKFDFTLSLDQNIRGMIENVSKVIQKNANTVDEVRKVQKHIEEKKDPIVAIQKAPIEVQVEKELESQISRLIKMRY